MDGKGRENRRMKQTRTGRTVKMLAIFLSAVCIVLTGRTCRVPVQAADAAVITLDCSAYTLQTGKRGKLEATVTDERYQSEKLVWTSSNKDVVSVNETGAFRAKKEGSAIITATISQTERSASCQIYVVGKSVKKHAGDLAALKAIVKTQTHASVSSHPDDPGQYTWTPVGKELRLTRIAWSGMGLTGTLSMEGLTALEYLDCGNNRLSGLDIQKNASLKYLDCSAQELERLDVSANRQLEVLKCEQNRIRELDIRKNSRLITLNCETNRLTSLNTQKNPALQELSCGANQLTGLDVRNNPALSDLRCPSNELTVLRIDGLKKLAYADCAYNRLTKLETSQNAALTYLNCSFNTIKTLNLGGTRRLEEIY